MNSADLDEYFAKPEVWYPVVKEYNFAQRFNNRRWRSDYAILHAGILIEYEGLPAGYRGKSRHTTPEGFAEDVNKYNFSSMMGYRLIRCTRHNSVEEIANIINTSISHVVADRAKQKDIERCGCCGVAFLVPDSLIIKDTTKNQKICLWCLFQDASYKKDKYQDLIVKGEIGDLKGQIDSLLMFHRRKEDKLD